MDKFDSKLDGITSTVNSIDKRFKNMKRRVDGIDERLGKAEALFATVSDGTQKTATEHSNFREEIVTRLETLKQKQEAVQKNHGSATPADSEWVAHLEATNKFLNSEVKRMKWENSYRAHSSEICGRWCS